MVTMYDKLKLWIAFNAKAPDMTQYLTNIREQIDHQTGEYILFGNLKGLKVSVYASGVSIIGSLTKIIFPNNIYPLNMQRTAQAIEKISDYLHLNAKEAKVTELEFGTQYPMQYPVECYLPKLGDMPKLTRYSFDKNALYYQTKGKRPNKIFIFYDKKADAKAKKMMLPPGFEDINLLKYEMRLKGRLPKLLGVPEVKASTLYDTLFYKTLMKMYKDAYFSIDRQETCNNADITCIKNVTDGFNVFVARCINQQEKGLISAYIKELQDNNIYTDRKSYSRLKKKLETISHQAIILDKNKYIQELDDAIINASIYM